MKNSIPLVAFAFVITLLSVAVVKTTADPPEQAKSVAKPVFSDLPPNLVPLRMREFRVSGSSVFWWMERSGIRQNTAGRERGRGLVAESTMWSPVVVVKTPTVNHPASAPRPRNSSPLSNSSRNLPLNDST